MYIYLSNEESGKEVYFDEFTVEHVKSPIIQTDEYYPFGLTFNSYQRENSVENKYLYNTKELLDEFNLNVYDYGARNYDAVIGRWWSIDPLADLSKRTLAYAYVNTILCLTPAILVCMELILMMILLQPSLVLTGMYLNIEMMATL